MTRASIRRLALAAVFGAAMVSGCNDDTTTVGTPPSPPVSNPQYFNTFVQVTFLQPADSTPVNFDNITLIYNVNDDPTAFDGLLM